MWKSIRTKNKLRKYFDLIKYLIKLIKIRSNLFIKILKLNKNEKNLKKEIKTLKKNKTPL